LVCINTFFLGKDGWAKYRTEKIPFELLQNTAVGIITGPENLEVIDIDNHFADAAENWQFLKDNYQDLNDFPTVGTKSGGFHIYYKCPEGIEGNQKLASRKNTEGKYEALLETRGTGGYVVFYNNLVCGDLLNVPVITKEQRQTIIEVCKALDERVESEETYKAKTTHETKEQPGQIYNDAADVVTETKSVLRAHSWTELKDGFWRRPGKKDGISATFGRVGKNVFYVFSSNADPFQEMTSYTPFGVLASLQFNGDYSAAAKDLAKRYNLKPTPQPKKAQKTAKKTTENDFEDENDNIPGNEKWAALKAILAEWDCTFRLNTLNRNMEFYFGENGQNIPEEFSVGKQFNEIDSIYSNIIYEMENNHGIKTIGARKIHEMVMSTKIMKFYNPLQNFFDAIPAWDNVDYIGRLVDTIGLAWDEEEPYFAEMFKKHLIRIYRTAFEYDYVNRVVLVIHGPQEIGKTKLFQWLCPPELYYDEPIELGDKDSFLAQARNLIINLDDLDQLSKKEVAKLKAYISKSNVNKRLPYARTETRMQRIASFVGTTNISDILADETNTRWIILKVRKIEWQKYTQEIEPMQIWAQVKFLYMQNNASGELTTIEKEKRDQRNATEFLETSVEREILQKWFYVDADESKNQAYTMTDIQLLIERNQHPLKVNPKQLTRELRRMFGEALHTTIDRRTGRFYHLYCRFAQKDIDPVPTYTGKSVYESAKYGDDTPF